VMSGPKPSLSKGMKTEERSRRRMTIDSPWMVGTLETLWSSLESQWAENIDAEGHYPEVKLRKLVLRAHARLTDAIDAGNRELSHRTARKHLNESQRYVLASNTGHRVNITGLRSHLAPAPGRGPDAYLG